MLRKQIGWKFDNTYSNLSQSMFSKLNPMPVKAPELALFNHDLSKEIDLDFSQINNKELALIFSGNQLPEGSESIAQAYAGHQFGHFTILGDGRALMIGEHLDKNKKRYDIQFKGSGKTPYSRNADGRAALGPMIREYIISEAMNSLKVPTTRSLAVVKTGEDVVRETILKGAILTRIASSHIRVGTFQYALISKDKNDLKSLFNYTLNRHYPDLKKSKSPAVDLLKVVLEKQIDLICNWMRVGFIHGVMNTDNMTISGETIDYGPCAFMDKYNPDTVFSSIDHQGRYSYYNQPRIAKWNLERFAESLLPLINKDSEVAIKIATEALKEFPKKYKKKWLEMMKKKLGLIGDDPKDEQLIIELLSWMHQNKADYTNTFCYLMKEYKQENEIYNEKKFMLWKKKWEDRIKLNNVSQNISLKIMREVNPLIIPRNHFVEEALNYAVEKNDLSKVRELLKVLQNPYDDIATNSAYQSPPFSEKNYMTYCGT
tara:strand:- start:297 stop:1757 length:1461 start_codon:yes stop_codon:yes gene_type:complete